MAVLTVKKINNEHSDFCQVTSDLRYKQAFGEILNSISDENLEEIIVSSYNSYCY